MLAFFVQSGKLEEAKSVVSCSALNIILHCFLSVDWHEISLQVDHSKEETGRTNAFKSGVLKLSQADLEKFLLLLLRCAVIGTTL